MEGEKGRGTLVSGLEGFLSGIAVSLFALKCEAIGSTEAEGAGLNLAEAHRTRRRNPVIMLQDVVERAGGCIVGVQAGPTKARLGGSLKVLNMLKMEKVKFSFQVCHLASAVQQNKLSINERHLKREPRAHNFRFFRPPAHQIHFFPSG